MTDRIIARINNTTLAPSDSVLSLTTPRRIVTWQDSAGPVNITGATPVAYAARGERQVELQATILNAASGEVLVTWDAGTLTAGNWSIEHRLTLGGVVSGVRWLDNVVASFFVPPTGEPVVTAAGTITLTGTGPVTATFAAPTYTGTEPITVTLAATLGGADLTVTGGTATIAKTGAAQTVSAVWTMDGPVGDPVVTDAVTVTVPAYTVPTASLAPTLTPTGATTMTATLAPDQADGGAALSDRTLVITVNGSAITPVTGLAAEATHTITGLSAGDTVVARLDVTSIAGTTEGATATAQTWQLPATMAAPTLVGATGAATLEWPAAPNLNGRPLETNGYRYEVTLASDPTFASPVVPLGQQADLTDTSLTPLAAGSYIARVWAVTDAGAGVKSAASAAATVASPLSSPTATSASAGILDASVTTDTAGAALHLVVVASGATAPSAAQIAAGNDATGSAAVASATIASGSVTSGANSFSQITGLSGATYDVYFAQGSVVASVTGVVVTAALLTSARIASSTDEAGAGSGAFLELTFDGTYAAPEIDPSKITVTCDSPGFVDGTASTVSRTIGCLSQRHWYVRAGEPSGMNDFYVTTDGGGNTIMQIVLEAPVYSGDSNVQISLAADWIAGVAAETLTITNKGDEAYPKVHARWATDDRRPLHLTNATFEVCAHAAHAFDAEQVGKRRPCDAVKFTITNGTTTITRTITAITNSTYAAEVNTYLAAQFGSVFGTGENQPLTVSVPAGIPASPVFACTVDLAAEGFAVGDALDVTAEAMPFIGAAGNVLASDGTEPEFAAQRHKILGTNRAYIYVDQSIDPATVVAGTAGTAYSTITAAMADPNNQFRYAIERANEGNPLGRTNDGVVVIVKPDATGGVQLGGEDSRVGLTGKPTVIENDDVVMEIIPAPGVDLAACELRRNQRTGAGSGGVAGGARVYGFSLDPNQAASNLTAVTGTAPDKRYISMFPSGTAKTTASTGSISNVPHFVMGGNFAAMAGDALNPNATVRGVKVASGGANSNSAQLVLGSDVSTFPILTDNQGSLIKNAGKMRWGVVTSTNGDSVLQTWENLGGFSIVACAAFAGADGGSGTSAVFNADNNTQAVKYGYIAMSALIGNRRINAQYDHMPTPSEPKWGNELFGSVVATFNHKRPSWGIGRSGGVESDYYRWGAADAFFYGVGKAYSVFFGSSSDSAFTQSAYVGPQRYRGSRYGMPFGGEPSEAGFPQPWVDPANGNWTVETDVNWNAKASTIALKASVRRDPQEDYTTTLVTGVVPANRLPLPFDLYGTAYPASGSVEAGPVLRA